MIHLDYSLLLQYHLEIILVSYEGVKRKEKNTHLNTFRLRMENGYIRIKLAVDRECLLLSSINSFAGIRRTVLERSLPLLTIV